MLAKKFIFHLVCDECGKAKSPTAATHMGAVRMAQKQGWKTWKRHVCPQCFSEMLEACGDDKVKRARLAIAGKSGETAKALAKEWGVTTQTVINWARWGYVGYAGER